MRSFLRLACVFVFLLASWLIALVAILHFQPPTPREGARVHLITDADRNATLHVRRGDLLLFRLPYDPEDYCGWEYLSVIPELIPVGESNGVEDACLVKADGMLTHRVILCRVIQPLTRSYTCALTLRHRYSLQQDKRFAITLNP